MRPPHCTTAIGALLWSFVRRSCGLLRYAYPGIVHTVPSRASGAPRARISYPQAPLFLLPLILPLCTQAQLVDNPELGLRVPRGFRVSLYADHTLANDIYAMTFDSRGHLVVTSQGYIKVLHDTNNDGRADQAVLFASSPTGGMGLYFEGNDLYFVGDGNFWRVLDTDGNGQADGQPERSFPLHFSEHGGHAVRKGPDGWWYVIGGNDTGFAATNHITRPNSPITQPEAGALLRISPDGRDAEIIAHGFRNPYDFDFNPQGEIFTYDSDVESDFFLPWYTPTRLYHVAYGGHHSWRLNGSSRSWNRPGYYLDTIEPVWEVGRGSPTGVVCYRHHQFPEYFRGGIFALDWTFGRIYFFPLRAEGASYRAQPELFLESIGSQGFAPTGAAVGPDGSLFVSIGGRKTRGAVYRIEYPGAHSPAPGTNQFSTLSPNLVAVLRAPQPLEAWSRALWVPLAQQLGRAPLSLAVADTTLDPSMRIRAIEVLTELFKGVPSREAALAARDPLPQIRARIAWSLGRLPLQGHGALLLSLAMDPQPNVRGAALEALGDHVVQLSAPSLVPVLLPNFGNPDKRVRLAAVRIATRLPEPEWNKLASSLHNAPLQTQLTAALAGFSREGGLPAHTNSFETGLFVLKSTHEPELQLQAVRLIMLALGDWNLHQPSLEAYTAYELSTSPTNAAPLATRLRETLRSLFPSPNAFLNTELSRLLAMLQDPEPELISKTTRLLVSNSSATSDFHYLTVLSRLPGQRATNHTLRVADTILDLDRKLEGQQSRAYQNFNLRLNEVVTNLIRYDPNLVEALLRRPDFAKPGRLSLVPALGATNRLRAAQLYLAAVRNNSSFTWSPQLVDLLGSLPPEQVIPLFRAHWTNYGLRDELLLQLAKTPTNADRDKFLVSLESSRPATVKSAIDSLLELPPDQSGPHLLPILRLLNRLLLDPKEAALRADVIALLKYEVTVPIPVEEKGADELALRKLYQPLFAWFTRRDPQLSSALDGDSAIVEARWDQALKSARWTQGNSAHGEAIFSERGCQTCHASANALGPDLIGAAGRFSAEDLLREIVFPNRNVAPPYRTTMFRTRDGIAHSGIVAFESADGVIIRTGAAATERINTSEIQARHPSNFSLMPSGLLDGLAPQDLADLYAYLKTLVSNKR